jgi:hypothetical protein
MPKVLEVAVLSDQITPLILGTLSTLSILDTQTGNRTESLMVA